MSDKLRALAAMHGWEGEDGCLPFLSCHLAALLACHSQSFLDSHLLHLNGDISEGYIPERPLTDGWGGHPDTATGMGWWMVDAPHWQLPW